MRPLQRFTICVVGLLVLAGCSATIPTQHAIPATTAATASPSTQAPTEADAVRQAFYAYKEAVLAQDGDAVAGLLSRASYSYYDRVRKLTLHAPAERLDELAPTTLIIVYRFRAELGIRQLQQMPTRQLIAYAVDQGLVGNNTTSTLQASSIEITGRTATVQVTAGNVNRPFTVTFRKEATGWKLDLPALFKLANTLLGAIAEKRGLTDQELVNQLIARIYSPEKVAQLQQPLVE